MNSFAGDLTKAAFRCDGDHGSAAHRGLQDLRPAVGSTLPRDAVAWIYRPGPSVLSSAPAHGRRWILRFERRSPPVIEPLMGWTGGRDTLSQVELSFPSLEAAIAYAERQGLAYQLANAADRRAVNAHARRRELEAGLREALATLAGFAWLQMRYGRCDLGGTPDLERALREPAAAFGAPSDVLAHPELTVAQKREILARWAWDEHLQQLATDEAMPEGRSPSRLDEVRRALCALELSERALTFASGLRGQGAAG